MRFLALAKTRLKVVSKSSEEQLLTLFLPIASLVLSRSLSLSFVFSISLSFFLSLQPSVSLVVSRFVSVAVCVDPYFVAAVVAAALSCDN